MVEFFFGSGVIITLWAMFLLTAIFGSGATLDGSPFVGSIFTVVAWGSLYGLFVFHPVFMGLVTVQTFAAIAILGGIITATLTFGRYLLLTRKEMLKASVRIKEDMIQTVTQQINKLWPKLNRDGEAGFDFCATLTEHIITKLGYASYVQAVNTGMGNSDITGRGTFMRVWMQQEFRSYLSKMENKETSAEFVKRFLESNLFSEMVNSAQISGLKIRHESMCETDYVLNVFCNSSNDVLFTTNNMVAFRTTVGARFDGLMQVVSSWFLLWPLFIVRFFFSGVFSALIEALANALRNFGTIILNKFVLREINKR